VVTPTTQPEPGRGFDAKVHLLRFGIGILPFLVLASPFIAGLVSYEVAKMSGSASPLVWAKRFGFGVLFFFLVVLPVYMLGEALQLSRRPESQPKQSGAESVPAAALPSVGVNGKLTDDQVIDIWKTSIDVQQHFNDLELRIRNFAVTLLVAIVGATAFSLKERYVVSIGGITFPLAAAILCSGIVGWLAFYFMDRHWYHRLLLGSVKHTVKIEKERAATKPELGLSRSIGDESPWPLWGVFNIHSSEKITLFYAAGFSVLAILTLMVLVATPSTLADGSANTSANVSHQSQAAPGDSSSPVVPEKTANTSKGQAVTSPTSNAGPTKTDGAKTGDKNPNRVDTAPVQQ
jgi:hypothetical protein